MSLLLEVAGLMLVATVLRELTGGSARPPLFRGLTAVAVVVAGIAFWGRVWDSGKGLIDAHDARARLSQIQADSAGGAIVHADAGFLNWAAGHLPRGARLYLECGLPTQCRRGRNEWITYRLLPHLFVPSPRAADYVVFYYVDPRGFAYARGWKLLHYGSRTAIGARPG
jgi:hypothetical protein